MQVSLIGIDLAKSIFQLCGVNQAGKPLFNKSIRRNKLLTFLKDYPGAVIAMEACSGSNYWGRTLQSLGYQVLLIPPIHVKPFVKGNKNDRNDAFAITEASNRPNMHFVQPRTLEQTDLMMIHKIRDRRVAQRTALTNQLRGLLGEYGEVVSQGVSRLRHALPDILEASDNELTPTGRLLVQDILEEWQSLDAYIERLDKQIKQHAQNNTQARRLMSMIGVAEKTATAVVAYAGDGKGYKSGRHFAANLGLIPKEHSSGGKQKLGGITKRGNPYLRRLLLQGAWSIVRNVTNKSDRLSRWIKALVERRGKHKAVTAVAHKMARILWAMLYYQTEYQPR